MNESKSECVHKIVNKEKDAKNEVEHEEPSVTDNPFVTESSYFNILECGKNILNKFEAVYK